jgi:uracil-DNA glycosylase
MKEKIVKLLGESWYTLLQEDWESDYFHDIMTKVEVEYGRGYKVFPQPTEVFNAFKACKPEDIKVVWLGQDPYPTPGDAHGLSFSSLNKRVPASLRVIYKELSTDVGTFKEGANLTPWAEQGVFLLNRILTVIEGSPLSHRHLGWQEFTGNVMKKLSATYPHLVFVFLGKTAQECENYVTGDHLILNLPHPAAEAYSGGKAGFYGCKMFSKINEYLELNGKSKINW